jgi:hypothetical protein
MRHRVQVKMTEVKLLIGTCFQSEVGLAMLVNIHTFYQYWIVFIARPMTLVKDENPPSRRPPNSSHDIICCPSQWGNAKKLNHAG